MTDNIPMFELYGPPCDQPDCTGVLVPIASFKNGTAFWRCSRCKTEYQRPGPKTQPTEPTICNVPTCEGWWARRIDNRTKWFYVVELSDAPLSIWISDITDFISIEHFATPLARWFGPVILPASWED